MHVKKFVTFVNNFVELIEDASYVSVFREVADSSQTEYTVNKDLKSFSWESLLTSYVGLSVCHHM